MKAIKYIITGWILLSGLKIFSQQHNIPKNSNDSSIIFKVSGICDQCKHRIEKAAVGKGVLSATWDADSKIFSLVFNPAVTNAAIVQERILAAGHDIEEKRANDNAYEALPACCHYREIGKVHNESLHISAAADSDDNFLKGVVLQDDNKGAFDPLPGASIKWLGSDEGVIAADNGSFKIAFNGANSLVISFAGLQADTIFIKDTKDMQIILASGKKLAEVRVDSRKRAVYLSALNPIRTQIMTDRELFKAACCNLSESFETNPSVDVSYNDAVTGSKQIQLLGLSGSYTQLTVENLPGPRGIATPLGLNSIAGPWVESIQLTKGIGSVVNGYESIAGQINIELRKPENSDQLFANAYINDFGKTDFNLNLSHRFGKKWSTALLLHDDFLQNRQLDFNKDGFRDLPTGNLFNLVDRWKYDNAKGLMLQFGVKLLNDERTGGEINFNPSKDKFTTNYYGLGIDTKRYEAFAKAGYIFPAKKYKSIGLQLSAIDHHQDAYFGLTKYNALEQNFYSNLIYQSIIKNTAHKFRTGISFLYDRYKENFNDALYRRKEIVPGAFFEYTYDHLSNYTIVAGVRLDHNSISGWFITPRLHMRYEPVKGTSIHLSAGRGQRTANIFAENAGLFVSSRQVLIQPVISGKMYGLDPEVVWNVGISVDQKFKLFNRNALVSLDFYRNDFTNQVIADLETAGKVKFYNLKGRSYSNSFQAEINTELLKQLELRLAYRFFDVKSTYDGKLLQRPFIASHRGFINLAYAVSGWKFDYTISYSGRKRLPSTSDNPVQYQLSQYSPPFITMNAQVTKTIGKKQAMDFYIGGENLSNYFQKGVIVAADQPFSPYFDASLVWGPVSGRMLYIGWRYKIK